MRGALIARRSSIIPVATGAAFDPATGVSWYACFDARTLDVTLNDNDAITGWDDLGSGNQDLTVNNGSPTFKAAHASFNSKPVASFDGNDRMLNDWAGTLSQPFSLFVVARAGGSSQAIIDGAASTGRIRLGVSSANKYVISSNTTNNVATTADADTNAHAFIADYNGASSRLRVDSTETTGSAGTAAATGIRLAHLHDGSANLVGEILFVGVKASLLSAGEVTNLEDWASTYAGTP